MPGADLRNFTAIRPTGACWRCSLPTWSAAARRWWPWPTISSSGRGYPESGFFLHDFHAALRATIERCQAQNIPTLLLGVSFALLDFAEQQAMNLQSVTVMETGGMKGRRRELTRTELHAELTKAFQLPKSFTPNTG